MQPAICPLCGKSPLNDQSHSKGAWVEFNDYEASPPGHLSHSVGLEYFCHYHLTSALLFKHKDLDEALDELKGIYPKA